MRRDQDPYDFWHAVSLQIAFGIACLIGSFFFHPKARSRPGNTQQYTAAPRANAPGLASLSDVASTTAPATTVIIESPEDLRIKSRLSRRRVDIMDGRKWQTFEHFRQSDRLVAPLIDQLYRAGAAKVLVDPEGGDLLAATGPAVYVELPTHSHQRAACFAAAVAFKKSSPRSRISADWPTSERFLEIDVGG